MLRVLHLIGGEGFVPTLHHNIAQIVLLFYLLSINKQCTKKTLLNNCINANVQDDSGKHTYSGFYF